MSPEGSVNTTTVFVTALHTRNAVTDTTFDEGPTFYALPLSTPTVLALSCYDLSTNYWFSVPYPFNFQGLGSHAPSPSSYTTGCTNSSHCQQTRECFVTRCRRNQTRQDIFTFSRV